ncbi:MAG: ATP-binding cassette domain-containing protein [Candidatus Omnitrophica bacterium]|nr:ATP-binding cassette domain-containing protein [Candidatus Omnitrophota bacterium]
MAEVKLEKVSKKFGELTALDQLDLFVPEGKFYVILGPSGCGKSTLLNCIAGLEEVSAGRVLLGCRDVTHRPPYRRNIAMVFQNYALYPHLSVYENIAFGLRVRKAAREEISSRVREVSRILDIEHKLNSYPRELSGGQQQRVATGRAIVRDPDLFLFDEPLSNLDAKLRIELRGEFIKLHQRLGKTIMYVTHDQVEAMSLGEAVVVLREGRVEQISPPRELYHDPGTLFVAGFIGTPPMNVLSMEVGFDGGPVLAEEGIRIELPERFGSGLEPYQDGRVYFGFRPAAARTIKEGGQMNGRVVYTESLGEETYARVDVGSEREVTVARRGDIPGDCAQVGVEIDEKRMFFFDENGNRIKI